MKVYACSIFWRDCDPMLTVIGLTPDIVDQQVRGLETEEIERAVEDAYIDGDDPNALGEAALRAELDLCETGTHTFELSDFPDADVAELNEQGYTII